MSESQSQVQIHLRLPPLLHDSVKRWAQREGVSMNTAILDILDSTLPLVVCPACGGSGKVSMLEPPDAAVQERLREVAREQGVSLDTLLMALIAGKVGPLRPTAKPPAKKARTELSDTARKAVEASKAKRQQEGTE